MVEVVVTLIAFGGLVAAWALLPGSGTRP